VPELVVNVLSVSMEYCVKNANLSFLLWMEGGEE